jgi:hypothetical protein
MSEKPCSTAVGSWHHLQMEKKKAPHEGSDFIQGKRRRTNIFGLEA